MKAYHWSQPHKDVYIEHKLGFEVLSHSEARELAMAILTLTDGQNAVKGQEAASGGIPDGDWVDKAATEIRQFGYTKVATAYPGIGNHAIYYCPSENTMALVIRKHLPKPEVIYLNTHQGSWLTEKARADNLQAKAQGLELENAGLRLRLQRVREEAEKP